MVMMQRTSRCALRGLPLRTPSESSPTRRRPAAIEMEVERLVGAGEELNSGLHDGVRFRPVPTAAVGCVALVLPAARSAPRPSSAVCRADLETRSQTRSSPMSSRQCAMSVLSSGDPPLSRSAVIHSNSKAQAGGRSLGGRDALLAGPRSPPEPHLEDPAGGPDLNEDVTPS